MTWTQIDMVIVTMAVTGALTTMAVTIIAAIKGSAAQAQALAAQIRADANHEAINGLASRVQSHDQQLNTLALQMPPAPAAPAQTANSQ